MDMMQLNKIKDKYLKEPKCIYCGSYGLDTMNLRFKDGLVYADAICRNCEKHWKEIYQICDITID